MITILALRKTGLMFLLSGIFFVLLCILLYLTHSQAVPVIGILFVSYISWKDGAIAGLILTACTHVVSSVAFYFFAPELLQNYHGMLISVGVNVGVSFLLGCFKKTAVDLRKEIEKRIQVENSLCLLQNELEQRVELRTRELKNANDLLFQARKMEAIGNMAGTIAHDFNNYLGIIMGYSELLIKNADRNSLQYKYAKAIEKTSKTVAELTSQLLTFARKKTYTIKSIDLNRLVEEMIPLLYSVMKEGISIKFTAEPEIKVFKGGVDLIKSALLNLSLNARDAMKNGGLLTITTKTVKVTTEFCEKQCISCLPGTYVAISVTDTGTGIEKEVFSHLFEPFFTTKEEGEAIGMGLAAVYGIVQSHNGAVFAQTELGKETSFTMLFPIADAPWDVLNH